MNLSPTTGNTIGVATPTPATTASTMVQRQRDFAAVISRDDAQAGPSASARQAAEDFVAMAFVEPLLAQLRETNDAAPPFAPGPAERQFGEIMDQVLSRQIVRASNFPLVDRIESELAERTALLSRGTNQGVLA